MKIINAYTIIGFIGRLKFYRQMIENNSGESDFRLLLASKQFRAENTFVFLPEPIKSIKIFMPFNNYQSRQAAGFKGENYFFGYSLSARKFVKVLFDFKYIQL